MGYLCTCARAEIPPPPTALLYLRNGLTDCVQIWYVGWGSLTKCLLQGMDGVHLHVRTCVPLFYKCSACIEIWYALGDPLVTAYAVVTGGVSLHVRTCTPRFCISGTARPFGFNFSVWAGCHELLWISDPVRPCFLAITIHFSPSADIHQYGLLKVVCHLPTNSHDIFPRIGSHCFHLWTQPKCCPNLK